MGGEYLGKDLNLEESIMDVPCGPVVLEELGKSTIGPGNSKCTLSFDLLGIVLKSMIKKVDTVYFY